MISIPIKISNTKHQNITLVFIVLTLLVVGRDFLHSSLFNYSFYLSESLLFSTFWLIFIPSILAIRINFKRTINYVLPFILSVFHISLFSFIVFLISTLFFSHPFDFFRTLINTTADYGIVCIIIYSMCCYLFFNKHQSLKVKRPVISDKIKVTQNNKAIFLDSKDILYVKSEKPYIALVTRENTYLLHRTLKSFLDKQTSQNFIQIHKSTLVNTAFIVSYKSRKNGDYDVQLVNQDLVRASRSYNCNFKPIFDNINSE